MRIKIAHNKQQKIKKENPLGKVTTNQPMPTHEQLLEEATKQILLHVDNYKLNGIVGRDKIESLIKDQIRTIASKAGEEERENFFIDKNITVEVEDGRLFIGVGKISSTWSLHSDEEEKNEFYTGVYVDNESSRGWTIIHTPINKEAHKALFEKQKNKIKSTPNEQQ